LTLSTNKEIQENLGDRNGLSLFQFQEAAGVGAVMRPGRGGLQGEDAIFMDLQNGIFAVADGAERASGASRRLTVRFAQSVAAVVGMGWPLTHAESEVQKILGRFRKTVESLLADIPYGDATTFTALKLLRWDTGIMGVFCHCGDSLMFQFDPVSGVRQITQTNFWLAGRTRKVYQAEAVSAPAGTVFLLSTDGIGDLLFPRPPGMPACLVQSIQNTPADRIPGYLLTRYDQSRQPVDDIAMIAVSPEHVEPSETQVFIDIQGVRQQNNRLTPCA
jgi:hypothetical protein